MDTAVTPIPEVEDGVGTRAARVLYPLLVGQAFGIVLTAATFIIVTRLLGPSAYGVYIFAFGFSALVNGVAAFGVGAYFSSELAGLAYKRDGEGLLSTLSSGYVIATAVGIILSVIGIALSPEIASFFPNIGISPLTLMITSAQIVFYMVSMIAVNALVGLSRGGLASIINIIVDIVQLILSIVLTIMYGVNGAVAAMLIGYAIGAVGGTLLVAKAVSRHIKARIVRPTMIQLRKTFSFVWPIAANNFLNTGMSNFSILFLGLFVTAAALGDYGAANRGLTLIAMIYGAFGQALLNTFTTARSMKKTEEINASYNTIMRISLIFVLPMIMYVAVMAAPGLYLLVSTSYINAPLFLTLMALGTMIGIIGSNISSLLISGGHTKSVLVINLISAIVQLVLIIALVPSTLVLGAIIVIFFIGNLVEMVLFLKETEKKFNLKIEYRRTALIFAGNLVLGAVLAGWLMLSNYLLQGATMPDLVYIVQLVIALVLAVVVYPMIMVSLKMIDREDIIGMKKATNRLGVISPFMASFFNYSEYLRKRILGL